MKDQSARAAAVQAAAKADIIWCSTCACEPLPEMVENWIDGWQTGKRETDAALVAHLRFPSPCDFDRLPARNTLCIAAQMAGMEFFERRMDCGCRHFPAIDATTSSRKLRRGFQNPATEDNNQIRGWGINE